MAPLLWSYSIILINLFKLLNVPITITITKKKVRSNNQPWRHKSPQLKPADVRPLSFRPVHSLDIYCIPKIYRKKPNNLILLSGGIFLFLFFLLCIFLWTEFIFTCFLKISSNFMHPFYEIFQFFRCWSRLIRY